MAKGVIDEFVTELGIDVDSKPLEGLNSTIATSIGKMGLLVAAAASAAAAVSALLDAAGDATAGSRFARNLDIGFESLQRLEFAAKQAGVESGTLRGALAKLTGDLRSAEAGLGGESLVEALFALGVDPFDEDGNARKALDVLLDLAEAVRTAPDQGEALAWAQEAGFGVEFVSFLRLGRDGILALGEEAKRTGAIMSQEAAIAAERYANAMDQLSRTFDAFLVNQGTPFIEFLTEAVEALNNFAGSGAFAEIRQEISDLSAALGEFLDRNERFVEGATGGEIPDGALKTGAGVLGGLGLLRLIFGGGRGAAIGGVGRAALNPLVATALSGALIANELQKIMDDPDRTVGGVFGAGFLNKLETLGNVLSTPAELAASLAGSAVDPLRLGRGDVHVSIQNENHIQGVSDPSEVVNRLDEANAQSMEEAAEDLRSVVVR